MKDKLYMLAAFVTFGIMMYNNVEGFTNISLETRAPFAPMKEDHLITETRNSAQYPQQVQDRISAQVNYGARIRGTTKLMPDNMANSKKKVLQNTVYNRQIFTTRQSRLKELAGNSLRGDLKFPPPNKTHDWFVPAVNVKADLHKGFDFDASYLKDNTGRDIIFEKDFSKYPQSGMPMSENTMVKTTVNPMTMEGMAINSMKPIKPAMGHNSMKPMKM